MLVTKIRAKEIRTMTHDLTTGKPLRDIWQFAVPVLFGLLLQQVYSLVDTAIVGHALGVMALGGVGATGSVNFLVIGFCGGLCTGMAIPLAQAFGAGDYRQLRRYVAGCVWLGIAMSALLLALTLPTTRALLKLMGTPEEQMGYAYDYIFIIFIGIPATILYNMGACVLRSLGDSKSPVWFLAIASVINIVLDLLTVCVLGMGVAGAAIATVVSQLGSGVLCVWYMRKHFEVLRMEKDDWRLRKTEVLRLLGMGVPVGLQFSITAIGSVILSSSVNTLGSTAVASMTAASKVQMIFNCAYDAMGTTMATYCGQNLGARKLSRIGKGLRCAMGIMIGYSVVSLIVLYFLGTTIALLFVSPEETEILSNAHIFLVINSATSFLLAFVINFRYVIQGLGFSNYALFAGLFEMVARTLVAFLLVPHLGFPGACLANPAAWLAADCFLIPCYFAVMRKIRSRVQEVPDIPLPI